MGTAPSPLNAAQIGTHAANVAKAMGVGLEIDYENNTDPNLTALQAFIDAYRAIPPYDPTGLYPARKPAPIGSPATFRRSIGPTPACRIISRRPRASKPVGAACGWRDVPPLPPARFTGAVRVVLSGTGEPECNNFAGSLENAAGIRGQNLAPKGAGITPGMLGFGARKGRPRLDAKQEPAWASTTTTSRGPFLGSGSTEWPLGADGLEHLARWRGVHHLAVSGTICAQNRHSMRRKFPNSCQ
jgi:hypothetical protein